jgi:hypothetical protein
MGDFIPRGRCLPCGRKVHFTDEHLCRGSSGDAVAFAESLFQALLSRAPSEEKQGKTVTEFQAFIEKCSPFKLIKRILELIG